MQSTLFDTTTPVAADGIELHSMENDAPTDDEACVLETEVAPKQSRVARSLSQAASEAISVILNFADTIRHRVLRERFEQTPQRHKDYKFLLDEILVEAVEAFTSLQACTEDDHDDVADTIAGFGVSDVFELLAAANRGYVVPEFANQFGVEPFGAAPRYIDEDVMKHILESRLKVACEEE